MAMPVNHALSNWVTSWVEDRAFQVSVVSIHYTLGGQKPSRAGGCVPGGCPHLLQILIHAVAILTVISRVSR